MDTEKSTYQLFEDAKNQALLGLLGLILVAYTVVVARSCFISPTTIEQVLSKSEQKAFNDGMEAALK